MDDYKNVVWIVYTTDNPQEDHFSHCHFIGVSGSGPHGDLIPVVSDQSV
jgi:hypothetical protein